MKTARAILALVLLSTAAMAETPGTQPAGASTSGGDSHPAIAVTSIEDSGPGTLREALADGERRITFSIGGSINLRSPLVIKKPNLTIDGTDTTAPGITIVGHGVLIRDTHDVILRSLRIRDSDDDNIQVSGDSWNVLIENCSSSQAKDGAIDVVCDYRHPERCPHNVTISNCLLADTPHAMLVSTAVNLLVTGNLFVGNDQRSPQLHDVQGFDLRNNLICEWGSYGARIRAGSRGNVVNNAFGPSSNPGKKPESALVLEAEPIDSQGSAVVAFVEGNQGPSGKPLPIRGTSPSPVIAPAPGLLAASGVPATVIATAGARPLDSIDRGYMARTESLVNSSKPNASVLHFEQSRR